MRAAILVNAIWWISCVAWGGEPVVQTLEVVSGQKVKVKLRTGGTIRVNGWDKEKLSVVTDPAPDGSLAVTVEHRSWGYLIRNKVFDEKVKENFGISTQLWVPRSFNLDLHTTGGQISVEGVKGHMAGETLGGPILLTDVEGTVDMKTMGGNISVSNSILDGDIRTLGGSVEFDHVEGTVTAKTLGGSYSVSPPDTSGEPLPDEPQQISLLGGPITVDEAPAGAQLETLGGKIHVKQAKCFVIARTLGGPIQIDAIDGWVQAETQGGDVAVTMVGDPSYRSRDVEITSQGGHVQLNLPKEISAQFDVTITCTDHSQEWKVVSDFPLKQRVEERRRIGKRMSKKEIKAHGVTLDGHNVITVKTANGNVTIRAMD